MLSRIYVFNYISPGMNKFALYSSAGDGETGPLK